MFTEKMPLGSDVDLQTIAKQAGGYTGADLSAMCRSAATIALKQYMSSNEEVPSKVTADNFRTAMRTIRPSAARGLAVEVPPIAWEDIGGLESVKQELKQAIEWPILHQGVYDDDFC